MTYDLWALAQIDVRKVADGSESASWALGFVAYVVQMPWSRTRARLRGSPDWLGWSATEDKLAELTDVTVAIAAGKKKSKYSSWRPASEVKPPKIESVRGLSQTLGGWAKTRT